MKFICMSIALLISATSFAASTPTVYRINSQVFVDGTLVASPRIVTLANQAAEVKQASDDDNKPAMVRVKVVPSDAQHEKIKDGILMNFEVEYVAGSRKIKSSPQILAKPGSEAIISLGQAQGHEELLLKVTAHRE